MKDVFKKIAGIFGIEKDEPPYSESHHSSEVELRSEPHVRTKSIYPQSTNGSKQFRFPVIPDSIHEEISKERKPSVKEPSTFAAPNRKKPFQPTEVISPIYGRKHPSSLKKGKAVENTDSHVNTRIIQKEQSDPQIPSINKPVYKGEQKFLSQTVLEAQDTKMDTRERDIAEIPTIEIESIPRNEQSTQIEQAVAIHIEEEPHQVQQADRVDGDHAEISTIEVESIPRDEQPDQITQTVAIHIEEEPHQVQQEDQVDRDQAEIPTIEIESNPQNESPDQVEQTAALEPETVLKPGNQIQSERAAHQRGMNGHLENMAAEERLAERPLSMQPNDNVVMNDKGPIQTLAEKANSLQGAQELQKVRQNPNYNYQLPPFTLLRVEPEVKMDDWDDTERQMFVLSQTLENFHVKGDVIGATKGPTVTRFEVQPAPGVKVNKFTGLIDDIKLALAAKDIRMEAPIPGRSAIGIEVPNEKSTPVFLRSLVESDGFLSHPSPLAIALGRDISGQPIIGDLKTMPHGLIAGSTGSGKSVCINSIIVSLLYKAAPSEVRLILIDPKVVELAPYNNIPHLLTPVVSDAKQATAALKWAVEEMDRRYSMFADSGARDMERYNRQMEKQNEQKLPYIVIIIDELADLMMVAPHDVEEAICRIAQKARACGIHLLVATQRPSVDVITGLIKANIPSRIAFAVSSQADSRTILDMGGAERLLGKGDMLYYPSGLSKPVRVQGNFVSDDEIERVIDHVKGQQPVSYLFEKEDLCQRSTLINERDELFDEALLFTVDQGQASASSLQRRFRIGYNRAARLIDQMEAEGFISGQSGSKPRDILLSRDEYEELFG